MAITVMIIMGPTFSSVLKNEFQFTKQLITKKNIKIAKSICQNPYSMVEYFLLAEMAEWQTR